MSELSIFNFQDHIVRTIIIDGVPWFVASDVATALGYADPSKAIQYHCKRSKPLNSFNSDNLSELNKINALSPNAQLIPEGDLYRLIIKSTLPSAEKFESWVMDEVLPAIRKTGQYSPANKLTAAQTWEQQRQIGKEIRDDFTNTLQDHGVTGFGFAQCTNGIYRPLFGNTAAQLKAQRGLPKKASLRDAMSGEELVAAAFAEIVASQRIDANADQGNSPCYKTCKTSGEAVGSLLVKKLK